MELNCAVLFYKTASKGGNSYYDDEAEAFAKGLIRACLQL